MPVLLLHLIPRVDSSFFILTIHFVSYRANSEITNFVRSFIQFNSNPSKMVISLFVHTHANLCLSCWINPIPLEGRATLYYRKKATDARSSRKSCLQTSCTTTSAALAVYETFISVPASSPRTTNPLPPVFCRTSGPLSLRLPHGTVFL